MGRRSGRNSDETYDRLGIPEAEKKYLSGVKAQYDSEVVYGSLQEDLSKQGGDLSPIRTRRCGIIPNCSVNTSAR